MCFKVCIACKEISIRGYVQCISHSFLQLLWQPQIACGNSRYSRVLQPMCNYIKRIIIEYIYMCVAAMS